MNNYDNKEDNGKKKHFYGHVSDPEVKFPLCFKC